MLLPIDLQEKIMQMLRNNKQKELKDTQKNLTSKYKNKSGEGRSLIETKNDSLVYAISRMPATYSVILTLLNQLKFQNLIKNIKTAFDVGSGTGSGYFALKSFDEDIKVSLFERDKYMINTFCELENSLVPKVFDLTKDNLEDSADLIITSYVLSELSDEQRIVSAKKLFDKTDKYLLIIDTGTPEVWKKMMQIKEYLVDQGAKVLAPCQSEKCLLKNDYCQFFARVERSSIHRSIKSAMLPYEDEKYFYLLISKTDNLADGFQRIIRRPIYSANNVELMLCTKDGVKLNKYSKGQKEIYKQAKKSKINDII